MGGERREKENRGRIEENERKRERERGWELKRKGEVEMRR